MTDEYLARIGNLIRDARLHRGMTQTQVAEILNTSQSAVARMEQGKQNLSLETVAKVSAEWKSPSAVEPSPHQVAAIRVSPFDAEAIAQPTACGYWVVRLPEIEKKPVSRAEYMIGSCLPCSLSPLFE